LNYNADEVQWVDAVNRCNENGATLVPFQPDPGSNGKNVTVVKRSVHFKFGNESWVGDYTTYDVIKGSGDCFKVKYLYVLTLITQNSCNV
jgi:hypothetical protein